MMELCAVFCHCVHRCVCMAHVCFYVRCSDCGVCGNVCCVAGDVKDNVFLFLGVMK